jgi:hypothetical protein
MNNEIEIKPVSEMEADTRRLCEIRFDCMVTMHDAAFKKYKGMWGQENQSKKPQWFKSNTTLTLEFIKDAEPQLIGEHIKQMFYQLEQTIEQYEQPR